MKTMNQEWYAVHRHDGVIQYATKKEELYFLNGSGFGIKDFDAEKVEQIDGFPPEILVEGFAHLDGNGNYKAIVDKNDRWNGWSMPYILVEDIQRFCDDTNMMTEECQIGTVCKLEDDTLIVDEMEYPGEYTQYIHMTKVLGKDCFFLGGIGLCFEFKTEL